MLPANSPGKVRQIKPKRSLIGMIISRFARYGPPFRFPVQGTGTWIGAARGAAPVPFYCGWQGTAARDHDPNCYVPSKMFSYGGYLRQ